MMASFSHIVAIACGRFFDNTSIIRDLLEGHQQVNATAEKKNIKVTFRADLRLPLLRNRIFFIIMID